MRHVSNKVKTKSRLIDKAHSIEPGKRRNEYSTERAEVALWYCKKVLAPIQAASTLDCSTNALPSVSASLIHAAIRRGDIEARMNKNKGAAA